MEEREEEKEGKRRGTREQRSHSELSSLEHLQLKFKRVHKQG